jgi:diketogulonate reductase-like aldo/keto reductase
MEERPKLQACSSGIDSSTIHTSPAYHKQALKAGFRGVDTAAQPRHYNEALVGDGIGKSVSNEGIRREDLYVSSYHP